MPECPLELALNLNVHTQLNIIRITHIEWDTERGGQMPHLLLLKIKHLFDFFNVVCGHLSCFE